MTTLAPIFEIDANKMNSQFTKRDFLIMLFKHKAIISSCFLVVTLLVVAGLTSLPPTYITQATLLIKTEQQGSPSFLSGITAYREPRETDPSNRKIETEMEILTARPLVEQVVGKLNIHYDDVYHLPIVLFANPIVDRVNRFKSEVLHMPVEKDRYGMRATVDGLIKGLKIEPVKSKSADTSSNLISVSLSAANPGTAQQALDLLVKNYIGYRNSIDQQSGQNAYRIVKAANDEAQNHMMEVQQRLNKLQAQQGGRSLQAKGADATKEAAANRPADMSNAQTLEFLKARLAKAEVEVAETSLIFTNESDRVVNLKAVVSSLKKRIAQEVGTSSAKSDAVLTAQRELKTAEDMYLDLKKKLTQISLFLEMNPTQSDSRVVVEPPLLPDTSEWKKTAAIGVLGSLAGLLVGLAFAGFREYSDHTLRTGADVENHLGLHLLGALPPMGRERVAETFNPQPLILIAWPTPAKLTEANKK